MTYYTCPVCGYNELPDPPEDWTICPCCLTEFGYSYEEWGADVLRQDWIAAGAKWGSDVIDPPKFWSPIEQLLNVHYCVTDADRIAIASHADNHLATITITSHADNYVATTYVKFVSKPAMELLVIERLIGVSRSRESIIAKFGKDTNIHTHQLLSAAESLEATWQSV